MERRRLSFGKEHNHEEGILQRRQDGDRCRGIRQRHGPLRDAHQRQEGGRQRICTAMERILQDRILQYLRRDFSAHRRSQCHKPSARQRILQRAAWQQIQQADDQLRCAADDTATGDKLQRRHKSDDCQRRVVEICPQPHYLQQYLRRRIVRRQTDTEWVRPRPLRRHGMERRRADGGNGRKTHSPDGTACEDYGALRHQGVALSASRLRSTGIGKDQAQRLSSHLHC